MTLTRNLFFKTYFIYLILPLLIFLFFLFFSLSLISFPFLPLWKHNKKYFHVLSLPLFFLEKISDESSLGAFMIVLPHITKFSITERKERIFAEKKAKKSSHNSLFELVSGKSVRVAGATVSRNILKNFISFFLFGTRMVSEAIKNNFIIQLLIVATILTSGAIMNFLQVLIHLFVKPFSRRFFQILNGKIHWSWLSRKLSRDDKEEKFLRNSIKMVER